MPDPTFFVIGAQKSGTTWLATVRRAFDHIGLDTTFLPPGLTLRKNARQTHFEMRLQHVHPVVAKVLRRLPSTVRSWSAWDIHVSDTEKNVLAEEYASDVEFCERLLGRVLPWNRFPNVTAA